MALATVGLVSGALGIAQFAMDNFFGGEEEVTGASVQLKSGLQKPDMAESPGGSFVSVVGFDENNQRIGFWEGGGGDKGGKGGAIGNAGKLDVTINQKKGRSYAYNDYTPDEQKDNVDRTGAQPAYINVQIGNDAICVAWVSVQSEDGVEAAGGAWTGDIPKGCGDEYGPMVYPSNQAAGTYQDENDKTQPWEPYCMWLDGDSSASKYGSMKFNVNAYGGINSEQSNKTIEDGTACDNVIYKEGTEDLEETPGGQPTPGMPGGNKKRSIPTALMNVTLPEWVRDTVVFSDSLNASALCSDPIVQGPDMASHLDCAFCDMQSGESAPLCECNPEPGCHKIENGKLKRRSTVAKREVDLELRNYAFQQDWRHDSDSNTNKGSRDEL